MMHVCPVGSAATQVMVVSWLGTMEEDGLASLRDLETWWYSLQKSNINTLFSKHIILYNILDVL